MLKTGRKFLPLFFINQSQSIPTLASLYFLFLSLVLTIITLLKSMQVIVQKLPKQGFIHFPFAFPAFLWG